MATDAAAIIESWRPSVVVREEGEHGSPVAAAQASVPWITFGWGSPLRLPSELKPLSTLVAPLWESSGMAAPAAEDLYGVAVVDPCPASLYGSSGEVEAIGGRLPIRPTLPEVPSQRTMTLPAADLARPRAYVGFGTVPLYRDAPELLALVVRAVAAAGLDVVVTTNDPEVAQSLEAVDDDRVHAVDWVSLPDLLPLCSLVVGHGGAGTTMAALVHGVPLLLLPRGAPSQARMAEACGRRGVAEVVVADSADAGDVGGRVDAAVAALTTGDRHRQEAANVAAEIAVLPSPQECVAELMRLAR
jgi:UDP:flavonoid glycosyltransferase YjiC (YdhE family)